MITLTPAQLFFIVIVLLYGIYAIVNRICKCIEHTANAKAFSKYAEAGVDVDKLGAEFKKKFHGR